MDPRAIERLRRTRSDAPYKAKVEACLQAQGLIEKCQWLNQEQSDEVWNSRKTGARNKISFASVRDAMEWLSRVILVEKQVCVLFWHELSIGLEVKRADVAVVVTIILASLEIVTLVCPTSGSGATIDADISESDGTIGNIDCSYWE